MTQTPVFACSPGALTPEEHRRLVPLGRELFGLVTEVRPLERGYALRFPDDRGILQKLAEFLTFNRVCCAYLRHTLVIEEQLGPIWLEISGPEGTKEALVPELVGLIPPQVSTAAGLRASKEQAAAALANAHQVISEAKLPADVGSLITSHIKSNV